MSTGLRVLLTNIQLNSRTGTELYTSDVACELARQGQLPVVYSPRLGTLARELQELSVPVVDDLRSIAAPPDVIHGHHSLETMAALLRFPNTPAIFVCHDCSAWHDAPPQFRRLRQYVAVDAACYERLVAQHGLAPGRVTILQNAVDLRRFRQRPALPPSPRRALLFSNYADHRTLHSVGAACRQAGVELEVRGQRLGQLTARPEDDLPQFDLVFAKARCAWEALATGAAVVICDAEGAGPLVTLEELDHLQRWNFGRRLLQQPLSTDYLLTQIRRYDAQDAALVTQRIRETAGLELRVAQLMELYGEVIAEQRQALSDPLAELSEAADFLQGWSSQSQELIRQEARRHGAIARTSRLWRSFCERIAATISSRTQTGRRRAA